MLCCIVESTGLCKHNIYLSCVKCPPLLSTWIESSHVAKLNTSVSTKTFVSCHNINFLSNITLLHPPIKQLYHIVCIFTLSEICCTSTFEHAVCPVVYYISVCMLSESRYVQCLRTDFNQFDLLVDIITCIGTSFTNKIGRYIFYLLCINMSVC